MSDLTEFLLARITEDEAVARAAQCASGRAPWRSSTYRVVVDDGDFEVAEAAVPTAAHIARHDPARVLAQCAALRAVVEWHAETEDCCEERYDPLRLHEGDLEAGVDSRGDLTIRQSFATQSYVGCVTLMQLASIWADHSDFDQTWRLA